MKISYLSLMFILSATILGCCKSGLDNQYKSNSKILQKKAVNMNLKESNYFEIVILRDVQGLFGGQNLYLKNNGQIIVQNVQLGKEKPGLEERRYIFSINSKEAEKVNFLINKHKFFDIKIPERLGVPDEARPTITVILSSGESKTISKWFNDVHPDFDAIYSYLIKLTQKVNKMAPDYQGSYDYDWKPKDFNE